MANVIYNSFKKRAMDGSVNLGADTIKVMLVTSAYAPDADLHEFKGDVAGEASGTGYTAGGAALAGKSVSQDNVDNEGVFDADDVAWPGSTITARGAVLYKDTGNPATSPLLCYLDFGADKSSEAADFTLQWNAEGILNVN